MELIKTILFISFIFWGIGIFNFLHEKAPGVIALIIGGVFGIIIFSLPVAIIGIIAAVIIGG